MNKGTYLNPIRFGVHLELGRCFPLEGRGGGGSLGGKEKERPWETNGEKI